MKRSEQQIIQDALDHLAVMHDHQQRGDLNDPLILDAVCLRLASAIEALSQLPPASRHDLFGDDWGVIWATRNRIAHAYVELDPAIIAATLRNDISGLEAVLRSATTTDEADSTD